MPCCIPAPTSACLPSSLLLLSASFICLSANPNGIWIPYLSTYPSTHLSAWPPFCPYMCQPYIAMYLLSSTYLCSLSGLFCLPFCHVFVRHPVLYCDSHPTHPYDVYPLYPMRCVLPIQMPAFLPCSVPSPRPSKCCLIILQLSAFMLIAYPFASPSVRLLSCLSIGLASCLSVC